MMAMMSGLIFLARRSTSSPSRSGRRRSMTAISMGSSRSLCKPASPLSATQVSWPWRVRIFRQVSRISGSSSTTRTRAVSTATGCAAAMSVALHWKHDAECRTLAREIVQADFSAVIANDSIAHRQTQPRTLACRLGGEKRIKDASLVLLRNSCPRIRNVDDHLASASVGEADAQKPTLRHCVDGVVHKVDEDLLQPVRICPDRGNPVRRGTLDFDLSGVAARRLEGDCLVDELSQVHGSDGQRRGPRKGEQA